MRTTIDQLLQRCKINEGMLRRSCGHLGIHLNDQTIGHYFGRKSILKPHFVRFITGNLHFFKQYQTDYYRAKCPESLANEIDRDPKVIYKYLKQHYPICFTNEKFEPSSSRYLKYVSSYEIDYDLGLNNGAGTNKLSALSWHFGLNKKSILDEIEGKWHR